MKAKTVIKRGISVVYALLLLIHCVSCAMQVQARDLMSGISSNVVQGKAADDAFIASTAEFSLELWKCSIDQDKNSLISPLSVLLALAMTANGADGSTLSQMQAVLGQGMTMDQLNAYLYAYMEALPSEETSKLNIANSIWFRDEEERLRVEQNFLQTNADYYRAAAYRSAFDGQTVKDINGWVKEKTDGLIDEIIDKIDDRAMMYLINAIVFDAEWEKIYSENSIIKDNFTALDGSKQHVDFMHSIESLYLDDTKATGFIKPYANKQYSFVALLPNEGEEIHSYIASLTGERWVNMLKGAEETSVDAALPKFKYDYTILMNDALTAMGMPNAFSGGVADFSKLGTSSDGNIYISEVLHKSNITVDERGTKAGAVTKVEMRATSATPESTKRVVLDRPFVYAIVDHATMLPIFMGTLMSCN